MNPRHFLTLIAVLGSVLALSGCAEQSQQDDNDQEAQTAPAQQVPASTQDTGLYGGGTSDSNDDTAELQDRVDELEQQQAEDERQERQDEFQAAQDERREKSECQRENLGTDDFFDC